MGFFIKKSKYDILSKYEIAYLGVTWKFVTQKQWSIQDGLNWIDV